MSQTLSPGQPAVTTDSPTEIDEAHDIVAVPVRHVWRWVSAAAVLFGVAWAAQSVLTNPNIDFPVIGRYLLDWNILHGVALTILVTVIAMAVSTVLAIVLAAMRLSNNPVLSAVAWCYVWVFRGTPMLVQIVLWGYLGLLYRKLSLGIPFTSVVFASADTNALISAFTAGCIALTLNQAAYSSEIVRAGMLSVDEGQREASYSLGMSPLYTFRKILLPQAMRVIIPPMGNEVISMLKNTSLLSVIAVLELYTTATIISSQNLKQVELLVVVSIWYLLLTSVLSVPQYYLERRFGRGSSRALPPTPLQRLSAAVGRRSHPTQGDRS